MPSSFTTQSSTPSQTAEPSTVAKRARIVAGTRVPPSKRQATHTLPTACLPAELGKYIAEDVALLKRVGWKKFVKLKRPQEDLGSLAFQHPAQRLLRHYKHRGAPVKFSSLPWSTERVQHAMDRGAHRSCHEYLDFLQEEFIDMIRKDQWVILPYSVVKNMKGLRLSPPGCVPQRDRRPRWICDYSFYEVNQETLPIAAMESMQFGHALDRILRHILISNPDHGPTYLMKVDLSDGFYRMGLAPDDIPKLGVVFPTHPGEEPLVTFPLVLPMGWKNSPPVFSTATETIADLANHVCDDRLQLPTLHPLSTLASMQDTSPSDVPATPAHYPVRDPSLPFLREVHSSIDVFVDDFIGIAQGYRHRHYVRNVLMKCIDLVFRPLKPSDKSSRREPISIKKLLKGDCSWGTQKVILGWLIDTVSGTVHLPPHRVERLAELLASIPPTQKRTSIKKWHRVLGELRSMSLALPGSRHLFSQMQHALLHKKGGRISLRKGVHDAVADFNWILSNIESRPTRIAELVPLLASAVGHHDASGKGCGGVWFPSDHLTPRQGVEQKPVLWRLEWPSFIADELVTSDNPSGSITISDLELAGGLLHLEALAQTFDIRERTVLSKTDNLATLFWQRKASTTSDRVPAYLLRLFGIHQRHHQYVPRHDYLPGPSNPLADDSSRLFFLSDSQFLSHFNSEHQQTTSYQLWTPTLKVVSAVISALQRKRSPPESLLVVPPPAQAPGISGATTVLNWPSIPFSKPSKTPYLSYKSSSSEFDKETLQSTAMPFALEQLKITYGTLDKRSKVWGPTTLVKTLQDPLISVLLE